MTNSLPLDELLARRVVWIQGELDANLSQMTIAKLLFLNSEDATSPIHLVVDSPGGTVTDGLAILRTIDYTSCPVFTYCPGRADAMAAIILSHGDPTHRYLATGAELSLSQPLAIGEADIQQVRNSETELIDALALSTRKSRSVIADDLRSVIRLDADAAVAYNLADRIVEKYPHADLFPIETRPVLNEIMMLAFGYLLMPIAMILLSWIVCSTILGEAASAKGVALIVGGLSLGGWDLFLRIRRTASPIKAIFRSDEPVPTIHMFPFWAVGSIMVFGGISLILDG